VLDVLGPPAREAEKEARLCLQRRHVSFQTPADVGVEVRGGMGAALPLVASEMGSYGKAQHRVVGVEQGGKCVGVHPSKTPRAHTDVNA
jgi:hypothetical protein